MVFTEKPDKAFLNNLRQEGVIDLFSALDIDLKFDEFSEDCIEELERDYNRLFDTPQGHLSLNESVYRENVPRFWGEDTVAVKKYIESLGLTLSDNCHKFPDHIAVEFEIMQKLAEKEAEVSTLKDNKSVQKCRSLSKKFMDDHLLQWVPLLCDEIIKHAKSSFYKGIGKLVKAFIIYDSEILANE